MELCDDAREGFTGHENTAVIDVKGKIGVPRAPKAKLKKGGSEDSGKNGREWGALRGTTKRSKGM